MKNLNLIAFINEINEENQQQYQCSSYQPDIKQDFNNQIEQNPVSELQMHKILFLTFCEFYQKFSKNLFTNPNFVAWKFGPVELDYRQLSQNPSSERNQLNKFNIKIDQEEYQYLKDLIQKMLSHSVWHLVAISHSSPAWYNNYYTLNRQISLNDLQTNY